MLPGGMELTGERRSTRREKCSISTLSTTNLTVFGVVSKPRLRGEGPITNRFAIKRLL